jgi:hypothetical protein
VCGRLLGGPDTTPDLTFDGGDVGIIIHDVPPETYAGWRTAPTAPTCPDTGISGIIIDWFGALEGTTILGLRVDEGIRSGTFGAEVLFSVTPQ